MQKWEYLTLQLKAPEIWAMLPDGTARNCGKSRFICRILNALGTEGWEFTAVIEGGDSYLKRPKT